MDVTNNILMGLAMTDKSRENTENSQDTAETDSFPLFVVGISMMLAVVPLVLAVMLSAVILGGGEGQLSLAFFKFDQAEARESPVEPVQLPPYARRAGTRSEKHGRPRCFRPGSSSRDTRPLKR